MRPAGTVSIMTTNAIGGLLLITVVLAPSGPLRQELLAFLKSIPGLELVNAATEPGELQQAVEQFAPQLLILVGGALFTPIAETLVQLKRSAASVPCLVLAENRQQIQQAVAAGADTVLLKGFSTPEFLAALTHVTKGRL